ncbi:hypothetical protein CSOJ01_14175 [Colletotrichum sojae]|uniref:DUF7791 domain-containing protein n=1 Tax=Colletotrichum sojae TaxID=2175907 RepID=A0A8H6IQG9_9PEZI|nr:hypothetical protein CSOJ01_14175 [Colletotrichum sojae]
MRTLLLALLHSNKDGQDHFRPAFLLISYSFLDEYTRDQDFAQKMSIQSIEEPACDIRLDIARRMIYQRCMGLLETYKMHFKLYPIQKILENVPDTARGAETRSNGTSVNDEPEREIRNADNCSSNRSRVEYQGSVASGGDKRSAVQDVSQFDVEYDGMSSLNVDQINWPYPVQHGIRFIHRTALEFLPQPQVIRQIRDEALQFDEVDFELQAIVASMKLFAPSVHCAKTDFIIYLRHRLNHYLVRLGPIPEACFQRFQRFQVEAARVLRQHDLAAGYLPTFSSGMSNVPAGSVVMLDPYDALLLLASRTGPSFGLSSLTGQELRRKLLYDNPPMDIILDSYLDGMHGYFGVDPWTLAERNLNGEDRVAYGERIYRDVAAYLETGASPNSVSHHGLGRAKELAPTCWQYWLVCLLSWGGVDELCVRFLELFLLHGADANIWFWFARESRLKNQYWVWWPALHRCQIEGAGGPKPWFRSATTPGRRVAKCRLSAFFNIRIVIFTIQALMRR